MISGKACICFVGLAIGDAIAQATGPGAPPSYVIREVPDPATIDCAPFNLSAGIFVVADRGEIAPSPNVFDPKTREVSGYCIADKRAAAKTTISYNEIALNEFKRCGHGDFVGKTVGDFICIQYAEESKLMLEDVRDLAQRIDALQKAIGNPTAGK